MAAVIAISKLLISLAPEIRIAILGLVKALKNDDPAAARSALEAVLRAQFAARQEIGRHK
jgi:hypothetical protein